MVEPIRGFSKRMKEAPGRKPGKKREASKEPGVLELIRGPSRRVKKAAGRTPGTTWPIAF
jgi:hypothetical protein